MATDLERATPDPLTRPTALPRAVSVAEAARLLGCSVATIRRRIRRGDLRATTQTRPQGTVHRVYVPVAEDASAPLTSPLVERVMARAVSDDNPVEALTPPLTVDLAPLVALVERQQAQLVEQASLITLLAAALQQRALPAPREISTEPSGDPTEASRRPWWAALLWRRR